MVNGILCLLAVALFEGNVAQGVCWQNPGANSGPGSVDPPSWRFIRGSNFDGISAKRELLETWPEKGPPIVWHRRLGQGYSSFTGLAIAFQWLLPGKQKGQRLNTALRRYFKLLFRWFQARIAENWPTISQTPINAIPINQFKFSIDMTFSNEGFQQASLHETVHIHPYVGIIVRRRKKF